MATVTGASGVQILGMMSGSLTIDYAIFFPEDTPDSVVDLAATELEGTSNADMMTTGQAVAGTMGDSSVQSFWSTVRTRPSSKGWFLRTQAPASCF